MPLKRRPVQVVNNPNLTAEGQSEKLAWQSSKEVGQIEKVFEK